MYYKDKFHRVSAHHNTQIHKLALSDPSQNHREGIHKLEHYLELDCHLNTRGSSLSYSCLLGIKLPIYLQSGAGWHAKQWSCQYTLF